MSTNPLDVSDWIRTPAPFNLKKHGKKAMFSGDNSVVERRQPENGGGCVCYTSHPLPPGQMWEITILNTTSVRGYGLVSTISPIPPIHECTSNKHNISSFQVLNILSV